MRLGFLTACMPERPLEDDRRLGRGERLRDARARGVAGRGRPPLRGAPPRGRRVRRGRGRAGRGRARGQRADRLGPRLLRQQPPPRRRGARGDPRAPAGVHRRVRRARRPAGRHLHRARPGTLGRREPPRGRPGLPGARRLRGRARREADDRELRDGGLASGRLPGEPRLLARAVGVDVRARAVPELRPVAPAVAGHRPGRRAAAVRGSGRPRPRQGRRDLPAAPRPLRLLRADGHPRAATRGTWAGGATASPASARSTSAAYVDVLHEGGFDGALSVEHEDPVWGGTPERVEQGLRMAHAHLRPMVAP